MKVQSLSVTVICAILLMFSSAVTADGWGQGAQGLEKSGPLNPKEKIMASALCLGYDIGDSAVAAAGATNGNVGPLELGDTFTLTATGNGTGSWRIVGSASGVPSYVSGGTFPGSLTYQVPVGHVASDGLGFYVDSYTGPGDTISGTCGELSSAIPTLSSWSVALAVLLFAMLGMTVFLRRRLR